jgi:sporulation protein YlmC with PRC-barrel domain
VPDLKEKEDIKMNKKGKIIVALASVFGLVLLGGSAFAQGYSQEFPGGTVGASYQPVGRFDTFEASWMIGYEVTDDHGGTLGQISRFVIDNTNGRIALVVLSDVPNIGAKELALPWSSIVRTGENTFQFNPGDMPIYSSGWLYTSPYVYSLTWPPSTSDLYGIPSEITTDWVAHLYIHYGQQPYWTEPGERAHASFELYPSTMLMGAEVRTPQGEDIAMVNDLVIDSSDGHIAFAVLSDIPDRPYESLVAVPFGALSRSGENTFVLNTTREQLASAPSFHSSADMHNIRYADYVYRYFGQEPYWTE